LFTNRAQKYEIIDENFIGKQFLLHLCTMIQKISIERSNEEELAEIMPLFTHARNFMIHSGNPDQWINGYPSKEQILKDITDNSSFVCRNDEGKIIATFCFRIGEDPTYHKITGCWFNNNSYGAIHRLASDGTVKGIAFQCFDWCFKQINTIRVDTHADNKVMQHLFLKYGFEYCGIIYTHNGTERLAYQLTKQMTL